MTTAAPEHIHGLADMKSVGASADREAARLAAVRRTTSSTRLLTAPSTGSPPWRPASSASAISIVSTVDTDGIRFKAHHGLPGTELATRYRPGEHRREVGGESSDVLRLAPNDWSRGPATVDGLGGRGLLIVDRLASDWGAVPTRAGKRVWFEVDAGGL